MTTVIDTPEGPIPVPYPYGGNPPPLPSIPNPLPELKYDIEQGWSSVASTVSSLWHKGVSFLEGAAAVTVTDVETIVDTAINASQTAWSSFVSTLESWITLGVAEIADTMDSIRLTAREAAVELGQMIEGLSAEALGWVADAIAEAERYADRVVDDLAHTVLGELGNVETWVIDSIASPLLDAIAQAKADVLDTMLGLLGDTQSWVQQQLDAETLARLAEVGALAATVAQVATWLDECGAPMCEEFGPGSAASQLFNDAKLLELLSLLASLGTLADPALVGDIAVPLARKLGPPLTYTIETWLEPLNVWTKDYVS